MKQLAPRVCVQVNSCEQTASGTLVRSFIILAGEFEIRLFLQALLLMVEKFEVSLVVIEVGGAIDLLDGLDVILDLLSES